MARPPAEKKPPRGQRDLSLPWQEWRFEVGEPEHGQRLDVFLAERLPWRSRTAMRDDLVPDGPVRVLPHKDPQQAPVAAVKPGLKLRKGQEVVVRLPAPGAGEGAEPAAEPAEAPELEVVYEDEWLVAVNKPPGVAVHPSRGHLTGSLIHLVHERHRALGGGEGAMPTLCHRLDRETTGLLLCAKDRRARTRIGRAFEQRRVKKTYLALVEGLLAEDEGVVDRPIGKALGAEVRLKMAVREDGVGQHAVTRWRVVSRHPGSKAARPPRDVEAPEGLTLVELRPETGRQHQLRVHMAALGHPIVGDKLYLGGDEVFVRAVSGELTPDDEARLGLSHQALHSWGLELEHPYTGFPLRLEAPLWPTVSALLAC